MMRTILLAIYIFLIPTSVLSQHTFSIVAVDSITGEIGSSGATCLDNIILNGEEGALVISDIILGKGAIHTQAWWYPQNQYAARNRMEIGDSPQEIIEWLIQNDNGNDGHNINDRQYGIVDLYNGHPRSAAFTGGNNPSVANHITGPNYSIQGNILLEQDVLDDMESGFLNKEGSLGDKLMAAMQGAKRIGADSRCLSDGVSSLSAFLRVAVPGDSISEYGKLSIDINIGNTPDGIDPIDSLQKVYDSLKVSTIRGNSINIPDKFALSQNYPNPFNPSTTIEFTLPKSEYVELKVYNILGKEVSTLVSNKLNSGNHTYTFDGKNLASGVYYYQLVAGEFHQVKKMILLK
jgi:uncharacterized Ntn-hydrolase superfamily protein